MLYKKLLPICIVSLCVVALFNSGAVNSRSSAPDILVYGGTLPGRAVSRIAEMNSHLTHAVDIVHAGPGRIILKDDNNLIREYCLRDSVLWSDQSPMLAKISFLHFEYRDRWGNLLHRPFDETGQIREIAYTMRLDIKHSGVFTRYRTQLSEPLLSSTVQLALTE